MAVLFEHIPGVHHALLVHHHLFNAAGPRRQDAKMQSHQIKTHRPAFQIKLRVHGENNSRKNQLLRKPSS